MYMMSARGGGWSPLPVIAWAAKDTSTHPSWLTIWKRTKRAEPKSSKLKNGFSAILGALLFAEASPLWTWVGAVVIFGAAYYNTRQEKRLGGRPLR